MKNRKHYLLSLACIALPFVGHADVGTGEVAETLDALKAKRSIAAKEGRGDGVLTLSGSVMFDHTSQHYRVNGVDQTGGKTTDKARHFERITPTIRLEYDADKTYARLAIACRNPLGLSDLEYGSRGEKTFGKDNSLTLEEGYFGVKLFEDSDTDFCIEVGRQSACNAFTSKIQFGSNIDGVLVKAKQSVDGIGDLHLHAAGRTYNALHNHFGYTAEVGADKVGGSGFGINYSINRFTTGGYGKTTVKKDGFVNGVYTENHPYLFSDEDRESVAELFRYTNSQIHATYKLAEPLINNETTLFGGFLYNHAAHKQMSQLAEYKNEDRGKQNKGWYAGVTLGAKPKVENDWQVEGRFERVDANAVPDYDSAALKVGSSKGKIKTKPNYKGARLIGKYAMTDNLHLSLEGRMMREADKKVEGAIRYRAFVFGAAYLF